VKEPGKDWNNQQHFIMKHNRIIMIISTTHIVICWILAIVKILPLFAVFQTFLYLVNPSLCFFNGKYISSYANIRWFFANLINLFFTIVYFI